MAWRGPHVEFLHAHRWHLERGEWRVIESLNAPPPRCSHQVRRVLRHNLHLSNFLLKSMPVSRSLVLPTIDTFPSPPLRASRVLHSSPPGVLPLLQLLACHARPHRDKMSFLLPFFPPPSPGCLLPGAPLRVRRGIRDKRPILPLSRPLAVSLPAIFQPAFCSSRRPGFRKRPSHLFSAPFLFFGGKAKHA
jgi:hypothetical protein